MQVGSVNKDLYLVDGSSTIDIGYSMTAATIEKYTSAPKAEVRPANHTSSKEGV
jgi:hypothetical protein